MIPPALCEMRESMLGTKFDNLVENGPKVQNKWISKEETGNKPVEPMNQIVMVNVFPKTAPGERAIIIVGMHASLNLGIKRRIEESEGLSTKIGPLIQHVNKEAVVEEHQVYDTACCALKPRVLNGFNVGVQVSKR